MQPDSPIKLTPRETVVLKLLVAGDATKVIADKMNISDQTAKNHISSILSKLGANNRTQAAVTAVRLGLVDGGQV